MEFNSTVNAMFNYVTGYLIAITTIKKQNRKHHKSRINKKWAKRYGFTYIDRQEPDVLIVDHTIYVTQKGYEMLLKAVQDGGEQWQSELAIRNLKT